MSAVRLVGRFWEWTDADEKKGEHGKLCTVVFAHRTLLRVKPEAGGAWVYVEHCKPFYVRLPADPLERGDDEQAANARALRLWEMG
jgi:hypothetical protein